MAEVVDQASQDTEQRHQQVLEAVKRGDRSMADELLKKMTELNEKLGGNMLSLEEEMMTDLRQVKTQAEELRKQSEATRAMAAAAAAHMEGEMREKFADSRKEA